MTLYKLTLLFCWINIINHVVVLKNRPLHLDHQRPPHCNHALRLIGVLNKLFETIAARFCFNFLRKLTLAESPRIPVFIICIDFIDRLEYWEAFDFYDGSLKSSKVVRKSVAAHQQDHVVYFVICS